MRRRTTLGAGTVALLVALPAVGQEGPGPSTQQAGAAAASPEATVWRTAKKCGVNSLYVLLRMNHKPARYQEVEAALPVTPEGTNIADVRRCAASFGLSTKVIKASPEALGDCPLPAIGHIEEERGSTGHFVVITAVGPQGVELIDGTTALLSDLSLSDFRKRWSGYLLVVDGGRRWRWVFPALAVAGAVTIALGVVASGRRAKPAPTTPPEETP
jgi:hypothetical protein